MQREMHTFQDFIDKMVSSIASEPSEDVMDVDDDQNANANLIVVDSENFLTPAERSQLAKYKIKMTNSFIDLTIAFLEGAINDNLNVQNAGIFNDLFFKALARWLFFADKLELGSSIKNEGSCDGLSKKLYTLLSLFKQTYHSDSFQFKSCIREISLVAFSEKVGLLNIELKTSGKFCPIHGKNFLQFLICFCLTA